MTVWVQVPLAVRAKKKVKNLLFCNLQAYTHLDMETGLQHTSTLVVTNDNTAEHMGSGDMPVLATPAMTALMENAAMIAVSQALPEGVSTVGGHINVSHIKPTAIGQEVSATATLIAIEGKKLSFHVCAYQADTLIGEGEHIRFIVDRERFLEKITPAPTH